MIEREASCIFVEWDVLRKVFGEHYWNDVENIICVPTDCISDEEWESLEDSGVYQGPYVDFLISRL